MDLFVLPEVKRPFGGTNVLLSIIDVLRRDGREVAPLYSSRHFEYPFFDAGQEAFFDPALAEVFKPSGFKARLRSLPDVLKKRGKGGSNALRKPGKTDRVVIPEFQYPEIARAFPDSEKILAMQGFTGFSRAYFRDADRQLKNWFGNSFCVSDTCGRTLEAVGIKNSARIRLNVGGAAYSVESKRKQVAFMPRKLRDQVRFTVGALRSSPEFAKYDFIEIDKMSFEETQKILAQSLMFLSFSDKEGFGLPPAEAMLNGCLVVGYAGIGGREFFDEKTGFPVPDGDVVALIEAARSVMRQYEADPVPLDEKRMVASKFIAETYSRKRFEQSVLDAWDSFS